MARPPVVPAETKVRIVLSVLRNSQDLWIGVSCDLLIAS